MEKGNGRNIQRQEVGAITMMVSTSMIRNMDLGFLSGKVGTHIEAVI
jgi:hypothetical protein